LVTAISLLTVHPAAAQYLGVTCGYSYSGQLENNPPNYPGQSNISLYNPVPGSPNVTFASWAEQLGQSGVDFVCPNLVGSQPNTAHPPTEIAALVSAINAQGLTNQVKFAIFDDNAASWTAQWNMANGRGYGYAQPFDISNPANWVYIYDYNYKLFYQTVPDANRFKINGRPVIYIWTGNGFFVGNQQGNVSRAINYVRTRCQADFGFNPYIIVNRDFLDSDTTCNNPSVIDATHGWFGASTPYTMATFNGVTMGAGVGGFHHPGENDYVDPNHGALLESTLNNTVGAGASLTLLEGFTDYEEDAALYRARNIDTNGTPLSYSQTLYDFPNQRLSILRSHSQNPFPSQMKFEAEGCDTFGGAAGGNGLTNYYRNGNIAIGDSTDIGAGHYVGWVQPGEWLEWQRVPLSGTPHFVVRVATITGTAQMQLVVDGIAQPVKTLPNTGGWQTWVNFDLGTVGTYAPGYHTIRLVFTSGSSSLNWWRTETSATPVANGTYKIINRNSGLALDATGQGTANGTAIDQWGYNGGNNQRWTVTSLGGGQYKVVGVQSGKVLEVAGQSTADGAAVQLYTDNGGGNQKWNFVATSGGYYTLQGVQSGKLMEVVGQSTAPGAVVDQWTGNSGTNQQWSFQAP